MDNSMDDVTLAFETKSVVSKPTIVNGKIPWPEGPPSQQNFSLPSSTMYHITKNPSTPQVYEKLIQSCKYFFEKNPILVVKKLYEVMLCSNEECKYTCCVNVDVKQITNKFWLTNRLTIFPGDTPNFVVKISSMIYRSEIRRFDIAGHNVLFNDFKILSANVEETNFSHLTMTYSDGNSVVLETILESMPNIRKYRHYLGGNFSMISALTFKLIVQLHNFQQLQFFILTGIPTAILVEDIFIFTQHCQKLWLSFDENISDEYKLQLNVVIDNIIASEIPCCVVEYEGLEAEKYENMAVRYVYHA